MFVCKFQEKADFCEKVFDAYKKKLHNCCSHVKTVDWKQDGLMDETTNSMIIHSEGRFILC